MQTSEWVFIVQHSDKLYFQVAEDLPKHKHKPWAWSLPVVRVLYRLVAAAYTFHSRLNLGTPP